MFLNGNNDAHGHLRLLTCREGDRMLVACISASDARRRSCEAWLLATTVVVLLCLAATPFLSRACLAPTHTQSQRDFSPPGMGVQLARGAVYEQSIFLAGQHAMFNEISEHVSTVPILPSHVQPWRQITKWVFLSVSILIVLIAIAGFTYSGVAVQLGPELGNANLNLVCSGSGSPTVVLDAALGAPASVLWKAIQPEVAGFTRVCSYDRAGYGWSTSGPMPRTSAEIARELHALLAIAGEKPPYILVGHSFGGLNMRVFNGFYSNEVVGMVLVDASHEDEESKMLPAMADYMKRRRNALIKVQKTIAPILVNLGLVRLVAGSSSMFPDSLSPGDRRELIFLQMQAKARAASVSEIESFPLSREQARDSGNLGNKPLVVLTAGKSEKAPPGFSQKYVDEFHDAWVTDLQVQLARLSSNGKQIILPDCGHWIPYERPDAVVSAIREIFAAASRSDRIAGMTRDRA
jgi:pimeloyl-ACP methyl ester carboxylesterase